MNGKQIVRDGYDAIAETYLRVRREDGEDVELLDELAARLPDGARVLDAGCGAGVPVARVLSRRFQLTGVDLSIAQLRLAKARVPNAVFAQADMTALPFKANTFDAICSYYAIIHVPREEHLALLTGWGRLLKPGGQLLVSMGTADNPDGIEADWLGGGASMYWSHYGRETNLRLIAGAGFNIIWERLVTEDEEFGGGTHLFVLAENRDV